MALAQVQQREAEVVEPEVVEIEVEDEMNQEERRPFPRPAEDATPRRAPVQPRVEAQSCAVQARDRQPPAPPAAAAAAQQEVGVGAPGPVPFRFGQHNVSSEAYLEKTWDTWTPEDVDSDRTRAAVFMEKYPDTGLQRIFKQLLKSVHGMSMDTILAMNRANEQMVGGNVSSTEAFGQMMRSVDAIITGM